MEGPKTTDNPAVPKGADIEGVMHQASIDLQHGGFGFMEPSQ